MNENFSLKKIVKQLFLFIIILLIVTFLILNGKDMKLIFKVMCSARLRYVLLGILLAITFHFSEAMSVRLLLDAFGKKITFIQSMKYAYTGFFFSSITPSSTGGQPMQLYFMKKDGIELSHATLALIMQLIAFQVATFVFEVAAIALLIVYCINLSLPMKILTVLGFCLNLLFIFFLITLITSTKLASRIFKFFNFLINKLPFLNEVQKQHCIERSNVEIEEFYKCAKMVKKHRLVMLKVFLISMFQALCWFSVPFAICLALGKSDISYLYVLVLQILLYMISSLLPLPGAVGISEFTFLQLFTSIYSAKYITSAMLLSRGIGFYFLLLLSGILLLLICVLYKHNKADNPPIDTTI